MSKPYVLKGSSQRTLVCHWDLTKKGGWMLPGHHPQPLLLHGVKTLITQDNTGSGAHRFGLDWLSSKLHESSFLCPPTLGVEHTPTSYPAFCVDAADLSTQVLIRVQQALRRLSHLLLPCIILKVLGRKPKAFSHARQELFR